MNFPLKKFWFLLNQIDRLRAEDNFRLLQLTAAAGSGEGYETMAENLKKQIGITYVWEEAAPRVIVVETAEGLDPEFDRTAFNALRNDIWSSQQ